MLVDPGPCAHTPETSRSRVRDGRTLRRSGRPPSWRGRPIASCTAVPRGAAPPCPSAAPVRRVGLQVRRAHRPAPSDRAAGTSTPVTPSSIVSSSPPTALPTTGRPQAAASSGTMPNGSYHGVQTTTSARAEQRGQGRVVHAAQHADPLVHAQVSGQPGEPTCLGVAGQLRFGRSAGDHEFRVGQPREGLQHRVHALALHQPADRQQPERNAPGRERVPTSPGVNSVEVDAAGHDPHLADGHAQRLELRDLVRARRDDQVAFAADAGLQLDPADRAGVPIALMPALEGTECVEGLRDGNADRPRRVQRGQARHPEVRVHDVRPSRCGASAPPSTSPKARMNGSISSLPITSGGPAGTCTTSNPGDIRTTVGVVVIVAAGVHDDVVAVVRQLARRAPRRARSARRHRRRRAWRADWRARTPWRSSSASLLERPLPVAEESREAELRQRMSAGRPDPSREPRPGPRASAAPRG